MPEPTAARDPALAGVFRRPFAEQLAFWRAKMRRQIPTATWRDLMREAHDRALVVAGAMKAELLADLAAAVDAAIADGEGIEEFRRRFDAIIARHGWDYRGARNWRTRVIYATNAATSYAAGRLAQLRAGGFRWWLYKHSDAVTHPRPLHVAWDGLVLPADHPWWQSHYPPNGWGCKCRVVGLERPEDARALGGDPGKRIDPAWRRIDPRTGAPVGIDEGWDYQPGASRADLVQRIAARAQAMPDAIGRALIADLATGRAIWQAVREAEADVLAAGRAETEFLALIDERGERTVWMRGERGRVPVSDGDLARGVVAVHNHPSSGSLSGVDLMTTARAGLVRVIAVGHDGTRYAARALVDEKRLARAWEQATRAVRHRLLAAIADGAITREAASRWHAHIVNSLLARRGIIAYTMRGTPTPTWVEEVIAELADG